MIKKINNILSVLFSTLLLSIACIAHENGGAPGYFLDLGIGARALSMGRSFAAVADDSSAIYWNPSGLVGLNSAEFSISHISLFGGTRYNNAGFANNINRKWAYGVGFIQLYTDGIELRDENNVLGGEIKDENLAFLFSCAYAVNNTLSIGSCIKTVKKSFDDINKTWNGLDLSLLYAFKTGITLGVNVQNLYVSADKEYNVIPSVANCGISYKLNRFIIAGQADSVRDQPSHMHVGTEFILTDYLMLRAGFDKDRIVMGFGVLVKDYQIDYAYLNHEMGMSHRATFSYRFWKEGVQKSREEEKRKPNEIVITKDKKNAPRYQVSAKVLREIPTGIYHLLQNKGISVVNVKITNNTKKERRYKILYRLGLKNPSEIRKVLISANDSAEIALIPALSQEEIRKIEVVPTLENIYVEVEEIVKKDKIEPLFSESYPVTLLPYDQFTPEVIDAKNEKYDLLSTLVSWVTFNDRILSEVISAASEEGKNQQPPVKLVGFQPPGAFTRPHEDSRSIEEKDKDYRQQVKLLYDTLVKKYNLSYINQPIVYGNPQRIKFPFNTLTRKGNCIELSVLFASLMESIEIDPLLVIFPEAKHACFGWKVPGNGKENYHLLETNVFGEDFSRVLEKSNELINSYDLKAELENGIRFDKDSIYKKGNEVIIYDVKKIRESIPPSPYISR